ncbi:MAG: glycosyltransferase, partial [Actinomycetota bacterium]|nr:glycosyltransferase [Actinomycetota bacterium]
RGADRRTHVIHNGVPPCGAPKPDPELVAFRGDGRLAGSVCRLDAQKDPLTLVRAAGILKGRGRLDFRVAVVGNGSLAGRLAAEVVRLGLEDEVRLFPFRERSAPYLAALDAFVLPSLWESLPISVLEAMACSTPVIATRVGGTPEAVEDGVGGRLVAPGDLADLARVMDEVLHDPEQLEALARGARRAFEQRFTVSAMVEATGCLYERMLRAVGR